MKNLLKTESRKHKTIIFLTDHHAHVTVNPEINDVENELNLNPEQVRILAESNMPNTRGSRSTTFGSALVTITNENENILRGPGRPLGSTNKSNDDKRTPSKSSLKRKRQSLINELDFNDAMLCAKKNLNRTIIPLPQD